MAQDDPNGQITRRYFLRMTAGGLVLAPLMTAAAGQAFAAPAPKASPARSSAAGNPLHLVGWQYHPEIVEENAKIFGEQYGVTVNVETVPGTQNYEDTVTTKFLGGEILDLTYFHENMINRNYRAGNIRALDKMPGIDEIKAEIMPVGIRAMTAYDGSLAGLPYWSGTQQFVCNMAMLDQINAKPPTTYDELLDQARQLKSKGISQYPILPMWAKTFYEMGWQFFTEMYSEGEMVFDKNNDPTFKDGGTAFRKVLERWKTQWDEKLVPPDVFTLPDEAVTAFATGQFAFNWTHEYSQKIYNDPSVSKLAGHAVNALNPGATHQAFVTTAMYSMGKQSNDEENTWKMMRWYGYKDEKNGQFNVAKKWAILWGLGTVHKEVAADPEVVEAWNKWKNIDVYNQQMGLGISRDVEKQLWYSEWDTLMIGRVQDYIQGNITLDALQQELYDKAVDLKKNTPA